MDILTDKTQMKLFALNSNQDIAEKITPIPYIDAKTIPVIPSRIAFIFIILLSPVSPLLIGPTTAIAPTQ